MEKNKNLKLKTGLCGLALTSFLALNAGSVVHADSVQSANNNAITWNSDEDDSQVVKNEPQQAKASPTVQKQVPVQSNVQVSYSQPVQNKKVMVSNVSSTPVSQERIETSNLRQSNVQTSTVNRLNANKSQANIKVSNIQDVAQAPVQKQKVAQFNNGSKIYTLNGSNQLSKNNGDGYVITNAGMYNGRAVDIGVTINGVQDNQGTYTTKWSNGDKADVTGKTDANFKYQDSVLLNQQQVAPQVDQSRTRTRTVTQAETIKNPGYAYHIMVESYTGSGQYGDTVNGTDYFISPKLLENVKSSYNVDDKTAFKAIIAGLPDSNEVMDGLIDKLSNDTKDDSLDHDEPNSQYMSDSGGKHIYVERCHLKSDRLPASMTYSNYTGVFIITANPNTDFSKINIDRVWQNTDQHYVNSDMFDSMSKSEYETYGKLFKPDYTWTETKPVQVTDHLQLASSTPASLGYNYTVGLYDAQTGDLIGDLKAEYKGKVGVQATPQDSVMNNAIKSKIQQINNNQATVSYTGTEANDDVAFYKETRAVNPQDQSLHKSATRIISVNLPDDQGARDRYKGMLNDNNQIVQTINFTRTGVENVVTGAVTYGNWTGPSSFGAVTLPDIPGYTMTMD